MTYKKNPYRCPKCNRYGEWRHGLHFEHEMICFCGGDRSTTWCPDDIQEQNQKFNKETDYKDEEPQPGA